ncbi:arginine--tRNA ligase [Patescibacteria group bacterium]|nr:MAG: arginine--tRNA ligase [Patescibacteria group bacterium]
MLKTQLKKEIEKALKEAQSKKELPDFKLPKFTIERPENEKFGDYAANIAMQLAPIIKKSPAEIAKAIVKHFKAEEFETPEIAGGFINFKLQQEYLIKNLQEIIEQKDQFGSERNNKTIVIDYSSPNVAKPFGIGHLRSTLIGDSIKKTYKKIGWNTVGINHIGDWGTQFGKLLVAFEKWGDEDELYQKGIKYLYNLYVKFHKEEEKDPKLKKLAKEKFKKLESGDKKAKHICALFTHASIEEFDKIYKDLGIKWDLIQWVAGKRNPRIPESEYNKEAKERTQEWLESGKAKESKGAIIIELPDKNIPPLLLEKSDGATLYATRDLAAAIDRYDKYKFDLMVYEVGNEQALHFKQLFLALEKLGYKWAKDCKHISHGLYRFKDGKLSTRKGKTIFMEDIINDAIEKSKKIIQEKNPDLKNKDQTAKKVGIGAIKYNDLAQHRQTDIIFDWEKILNFEGNSGPYLQYTYARIQSIIKKSNVGAGHNLPTQFKEPEEISLLRELIYFPEVVQSAAGSFEPHRIANYLNDLARKFNLFYNKLPVLKAKNEETKNSRLSLISAVAEVLSIGLDLLGIETVEEM